MENCTNRAVVVVVPHRHLSYARSVILVHTTSFGRFSSSPKNTGRTEHARLKLISFRMHFRLFRKCSKKLICSQILVAVCFRFAIWHKQKQCIVCFNLLPNEFGCGRGCTRLGTGAKTKIRFVVDAFFSGNRLSKWNRIIDGDCFFFFEFWS